MFLVITIWLTVHQVAGWCGHAAQIGSMQAHDRMLIGSHSVYEFKAGDADDIKVISRTAWPPSWQMPDIASSKTCHKRWDTLKAIYFHSHISISNENIKICTAWTFFKNESKLRFTLMDGAHFYSKVTPCCLWEELSLCWVVSRFSRELSAWRTLRVMGSWSHGG